MANYVTLRPGNGNTEENKKLQQALKDVGYGSYLGSAGVDGIYGSGTEAAVRAYQTDNKLTVDGIAGDQTLGKLYSAGQTQQTQTATQPQQTQTATASSGSYRYDADSDLVYQAALKDQEEVAAAAPVYAGTFDQQVQELYDQVVNQKDFSYDLNGDALWQQYKDQYTTQGKLAMMDAMGQAAALTGGYGSSYAQSAGQQAYQGYLQELNDRVPELYQLAMDKYNNDQAMLKDKLSAAVQMQADEYGKYQDALSQHNIDVDRAQSAADTAYDRGNNAWYTEGQLQRQDEETVYSRKTDNFDKLANLIYSTGYTPSQAELEAAGMSAEQAAAYASAYEEQKKTSVVSTEVEDDGDEGVYIDYKGIGVDNAMELDTHLQEVAAKGNEALWNKLAEYCEDGLMSEEAATNLYMRYAVEEQGEAGDAGSTIGTANAGGVLRNGMLMTKW